MRILTAILAFAAMTMSPVPAESSCGSRVRIGPGETVSSLARRCGINVEALKSANPGVNDKNFQRGTYLKVPNVALPQRSPGAYGNQQIVRPRPPSSGVGQGIVIPGIDKIKP